MTPQQVDSAIKTGILWSVDRIDGKLLNTPRRDALLDESIAVAALLHRRYQVHEQLRAMGRAFARCPHCNRGEAEMSLLGFFNTVGVLSPPMFSDDFIHFMPPALSIGGPKHQPRRWEGIAFASQVRFELPSKFAGLPTRGFTGGVMRSVDSGQVALAREQWELDGTFVDRPAGWTNGNACYDATIAMFVGVTDTDAPLTTPEMLADMPAYDVYFLDAAYWHIYFAPIPEGAMERTCPACAKKFMPLRLLGT